MGLRKMILVFVVIILALTSYGQNYSKQFDALTLKKDTARQYILLKKWEKERPEDPELYTSYFNYYVEKSVKIVSPGARKTIGRDNTEKARDVKEVPAAEPSAAPAKRAEDTVAKQPVKLPVVTVDSIKKGTDSVKRTPVTFIIKDSTLKFSIPASVSVGAFIKRIERLVQEADTSRSLVTENFISVDSVKAHQAITLTDTAAKSGASPILIKDTVVKDPDTGGHRQQKTVVDSVVLPKDTTTVTATNAGQSENPVTDSVQYDIRYLIKAFEYINKGIAGYPNRIDMRLSKIYILSQYKDYKWMTKEIIKMLDHSSVNKNVWFETDDKRVEDPRNFMLNVIQDFIGNLFDIGIAQSDNIRAISETALKYYPQHVQSLSNIATVYIMNKDYEKGLDYFQRAEQLATHDGIILMDMANAYLESKNIPKAEEYFHKVVKYGNKIDAETAAKQLEILEK